MAYLIEGPITVHACPPGDATLTPCCGRNPHDLPRGHQITSDPSQVTCELTPAQRVAYRNRAAVDVAASLAPGPVHQVAASRHRTVTDPDGSYSRGFHDGSRGAKGLADRLDHLAALVNHYERHLTATGRHWVIREAHRRANTAHPNPEETAP